MFIIDVCGSVQELWSLLASAASTESGIPQKLLDEKAEEIRQKKERQDQINVTPPPTLAAALAANKTHDTLPDALYLHAYPP